MVSFSGDKLLGSAQAGLIVGRRQIVSRLRKHPLYRALRSDKIRLAALEATLVSHQKEWLQAEVPVIQMLSLTAEELEQRARHVDPGPWQGGSVKLELIAGESTIGGGAGPTSNVANNPHRYHSRRENQPRKSSTSFAPLHHRSSAASPKEKCCSTCALSFPIELPAVHEALKNL